MLRRFTQQKINNGDSGTAGGRPAAMLQTGRCHVTLSLVKNPLLRCGLSSKFFDRLLLRVVENSLYAVARCRCRWRWSSTESCFSSSLRPRSASPPPYCFTPPCHVTSCSAATLPSIWPAASPPPTTRLRTLVPRERALVVQFLYLCLNPFLRRVAKWGQ